MSRAEQDAFIESVNAHFSDPVEVMAEGRPHKIAKNETLDALGLHFRKLGRRIYLADEMSVLYPGEDTFVPDILAVLDVDQPADDDREAWVVEREGRGLDLVIEVLHAGDRHKDLVRNVAWYARLGIPEYIVYDRRRQRVHGWRLAVTGAPYVPIADRTGRIASAVLGLELAVVEGHLRFFLGSALVGGTADLIRQLDGMVQSLTAQADEEGKAREAEARAREAAEAQREAAEAQREAAEAQREAAEAQREAAEAQREAAEAAARAALDGLRMGVTALLVARGVPVPPEVAAQLAACNDPAQLTTWITRASTVTRSEDLFGD
jgi:Uma2 family endonuclease